MGVRHMTCEEAIAKLITATCIDEGDANVHAGFAADLGTEIAVLTADPAVEEGLQRFRAANQIAWES